MMSVTLLAAGVGFALGLIVGFVGAIAYLVRNNALKIGVR